MTGARGSPILRREFCTTFENFKWKNSVTFATFFQ